MDINIKEQKIVSEDEMNKMNNNNLMYDFGEDDGKAESLPDISKMLDNVIEILECMNNDDMKLLKNTDVLLFEQMMEEKFAEFSSNYYSVFKMILSGEDIGPLFKMFEVIGNINTGKTTFEQGEKTVGTFLTKFLPPELLEKMENGEFEEEQIKQKNKNKKNKKK